MRVSTTSQQRSALLGVRVTVRRLPNGVIVFWAIKERSSGNKNIDDVLAIKLVLCKTLERQWSKIKL